jgi:hypothetical protein
VLCNGDAAFARLSRGLLVALGAAGAAGGESVEGVFYLGMSHRNRPPSPATALDR